MMDKRKRYQLNLDYSTIHRKKVWFSSIYKAFKYLRIESDRKTIKCWEIYRDKGDEYDTLSYIVSGTQSGKRIVLDEDDLEHMKNHMWDRNRFSGEKKIKETIYVGDDKEEIVLFDGDYDDDDDYNDDDGDYTDDDGVPW